MSEIIKAYKGFNKDMTCTPNGGEPFQYEEGKEYECENADVCNSGFHACEMPLDVFKYYPPASSVYHEVEQGGKISKSDDDSKCASSRIKIGAELNIANLVKAHIQFIKEHITNKHTNAGAATAGDSGAATAGYRGAATAGYRGAATAGSYGAATAGDSGAATAGSYGAATAGSYGAATAGSCGAATSRGSVCVGENGIAAVRGNNVKAKGGIGAIIIIAEEQESDYKIKDWSVIQIDGKEYKPDTWYTMRDGEVVEADEG